MERKMSEGVVIYTMEGCPYCRRAKELLCRKRIPYHEVNLSDQEYRWEECEERSGRDTVPQIFFGERHIGGCDDIIRLDDSGELDGLIPRFTGSGAE